MNDKRFHELLNEYLDGELSGADLREFKQALEDTPRYQVLLRQYKRLQVAQVAAVKRRPSLQFGSLFPFGRICRSGALLMNSCVLLLAVGLFQARAPLNTDMTSSGSYSTAAPSSLSSAGKDDAKSGIQPALRVSSDSTAGLSVADVFGSVTSSVQVVADQSTSAGSGDSYGSLLAEEYSFVRL
ncbi:MAG: zf-HC2 domain-containing protein [Puniceicoccales bacterium]|jgi:anti-sigma factor RsiW|nr:zf-HC2 domain-containing protein [Puniceicoccales bacterium]